jgi:hypothetical protein
MASSNNQDELTRFLKILQIRLQEHQKAYDNFLTQIQKPIAEILYNYIDAKQDPEPEQEPFFKLRP